MGLEMPTVVTPQRCPERSPSTRPGPAADPRQRDAGDCVPEWVRHLDVPVWVSGPERTLRFLNRKAEQLLGIRWSKCEGQPCHRVVASRDGQGRPFCKDRCEIACLAAAGRALPSVEVEVGPAGPCAQWSHWTVIPIPSPGGGAPWIVHTATAMGRARQSEAYLRRVAMRSAALREVDPTFEPRELTPREDEILELLAEDLELGEIARELEISHTTVRNHVQRLTAAIGAHSVHEAVAMRLLNHV